MGALLSITILSLKMIQNISISNSLRRTYLSTLLDRAIYFLSTIKFSLNHINKDWTMAHQCLPSYRIDLYHQKQISYITLNRIASVSIFKDR
jgi:hypothetical protein